MHDWRSDEHYLIIEAGETLYRVEYTVGNGQYGIAAVNCVLGALFLLLAFLSDIITRIDVRYAPQLAMSGTELAIQKYDDCILSCDSDRLAECLQNLIEELPQIFESFHRGNNADRAQGNGLGLFICRRLMGLMNGEVYADIRDECFCITLVVKMA